LINPVTVPALELSDDLVRMDRDAAVHCVRESLELHLVGLTHDFGHQSDMRAVALHRGHAESSAVAGLGHESRFVGCALEHRMLARVAREHRETEVDGVLPRRVRELVDEGLDRERVQRVAHRAPVAHTDADVANHGAQIEMSDSVGEVDDTLGHEAVDSVIHGAGEQT
jgi:hypothetical protein